MEAARCSAAWYNHGRRRARVATHHPRPMSTLALVFILYFTTSGGAYTTETLIHSVGPGLGLLILLIVPLIWSVPEVLIVGELASMLPEEGGYYRWVDRAFGRFWAFQNGWLTWMYSLVDMAIYPVLFIQYLKYFAPGAGDRADWVVSLDRDLGRDRDQPPRSGARRPHVDRRRQLFIIAGFLALALAALPHATHPVAAVRCAEAQGIERTRGRHLDRALELHRVGQRVDGAGRSEGRVAHYPRALAIALPLVVVGYFVAAAHDAGGHRLDDVEGRRLAGDRPRRRRQRERVGSVARAGSRSAAWSARSRCSTRCCWRTRAFRS